MKMLVGLAALAVAGGLTAAICLAAGSGGTDWQASCRAAPASTAGKHSGAVAEARKALLSNGNDPRLEIEVADLDACAVEVGWKADQPQPTASVVKLLIALDLLDQSGVPEDSEADAVHAMLAASDDRVASRFWQRLGGPAIVRRQAGKLGLTHTSPPADPGQWGSTKMSPEDVVAVYRNITSGRSDEERDFLTEALESAPLNAADGFDQHFGIPRAFPGTVWAIKQGWGTSEGRRVLNTTGLVRTESRTFAVAVMSTWDDDIDVATAAKALTAATGALKDSLAGTGKLA
ncbi:MULTISPECIES: serine hydrolase [Amycolatopsis]|uniref:Serine hydrolase n=1 Tax=Amycolatopsis dendrobii TaxID=2760662 RepID=A0A7W3W001_9PSEU|nr:MULTISPECIES: serine hydrolase [Amycolatopsis]MBB1156154.1 serine hydrolase [Amycolatopsis dendrobii]UKD58681.1 class A beta-lactamase-related serine hydrolase [Amycolatopsis sp. FU40]